MRPYHEDATVTVWQGDCLDVLATLPDASVDAVVTDPPYNLSFMSKQWDRIGGESIDPAFMHWFAGFTDGEGCFHVHKKPQNTYDCQFTITLRADDRPILERIQRTLRMGTLSKPTAHRSGSSDRNDNPKARYNVSRKADLVRLRDLFRAFPLRAKKATDFEIWSDALDAWVDHKKGEWDDVAELRDELMATRAYKEEGVRVDPFQMWCWRWSRECLRVLKPGGHMLAFGGTRTSHRLACAIEDAGFEIRDSLIYLYGSGFPKSANVSKALRNKAIVCQCEGESERGDSQLRGVRQTVPDVAAHTEASQEPDVLAAVQRAGEGSGVGDVRPPRVGGAEDVHTDVRASEPGMEGRRHAQTGEGQLQGSALRPLPTGVPANGAQGRLHHGAPSRDGAVGRSDADAHRSGEPQGPQPVEQPAVELGALPDERRPQAWGGWPVCERCSQPMVPEGLGTALKPAHEPIVVARKPLAGTVAANVLRHGTGALNIDATRIEGEHVRTTRNTALGVMNDDGWQPQPGVFESHPAGRWPANVVLDESQAAALDEQSGEQRDGVSGGLRGFQTEYVGGEGQDRGLEKTGYGSSGGASRYFKVADDDECPQWAYGTCKCTRECPLDALEMRAFYTAKAGSAERLRVDGVAHPTVKPLDLMRWLVRLVTPPGGVVLDPFAGSGTTVEACILEGFRCIAIEREADYLPLILQRVNRRRDPRAYIAGSGDDGGLFDLLDEEPA